MSFEIKGQLVKKFDIESKTASFQTREFVILISKDNYPQYVKFQLAQERVNLIDPYNENEEIYIKDIVLKTDYVVDEYFEG